MLRGFFGGSTFQRNHTDLTRGLPKCGVCQFAPHCKSPRMEPTGRGTSSVLLVGEAPGEREDTLGKHFAGERGLRLRESLSEIGEVYLDASATNAMICKPGEKGFTDKNIQACRPALLTTIDKLKPKVIILLGAAPTRSLIPTERGGSVGAHDRWIGYAIPSKQLKAWLCPVFGLDRVLRFWDNPVTSLMFHRQLQHAYSLLDKEPVAYSMKELWSKVEIIYSPRETRLRLKKLAKQEGCLAFDYEANAIKPDRPGSRLLACSFCLEGEDTFSFLIKDDDMLKYISPVLRNPKLRKIASNMKNEERWTVSHMKHPVANWYHDTMIAAHTLDPRKGITSIKFQAFLRLGVPDYDRFVEPFMKTDPKTGFNRLHTMDTKDLLNYNGLDSLLEYMVAVEQRKELKLDEG